MTQQSTGKYARKKVFFKVNYKTKQVTKKLRIAKNFQKKFIGDKLAKFTLLAKKQVFPRRLAEKKDFGFAWRFSEVLI